MGFWHTGYIEFHELSGLRDDEKPILGKPTAPAFACEVCGGAFWSAPELARHRIEAHPRGRPGLFIRRSSALASPAVNVVSVPLAAEDVVLVNTRQIVLDGVETNSASLAKLLTVERSGIREVVLFNGDVESRYRIKFEIADAVELKEVDTAFYDLALHGAVTVERIRDFVKRTERYKTAKRYVEGLTQYLFGMLAKQQSGGVHIKFEEYPERYNLALDSMRAFDTALSRVIVGLVNFAGNVFEGSHTLAHAPRLQGAMMYFQCVLAGQRVALTRAGKQLGKTASARVPADEAVENFIGWTHEMIADKRLEDDRLLGACLGNSRYSPDDRFKLAVLLAEHCAAAGRKAEARNLARPYSGHPIFGFWADTISGGESREAGESDR